MKNYIGLYANGTRYTEFAVKEDTEVDCTTQAYESGKVHSVIQFVSHNDEKISIILSRNETAIIRQVK